MIQRNQPSGGGTQVTEALRGAIKNYRVKRGIYMIVVTDGEFADKTQVQQFVESLLPQVTPENPYAFRLHFVGAGEEVDKEFLQQLEALAIGQGVPLVTQQHHAHLRHSHDSILDEMDRAFTGIAGDAVVGQAAGMPPCITWVGDVTARRWHDGSTAPLGFIPRRALLGLEYAAPHPDKLDVSISFGAARNNPQEILLQVPLPHEVAQQSGAPAPPPQHHFHLPWQHRSPEDEAAREEATRRHEELVRQSEQVRQAEIARQAADMQALGRGGIPTGAQQRLRELGTRADDAATFFTSNLDPDETALLRRHGYRMRGIVTGSAMYHVGQAYASSQRDVEVKVLSEAYDMATQLAVSRLSQELQLIGAHGVVGVRLSVVRHEWGDKTIEVQVVGTAVEGPGPAPQQPWLSDLSGQEWWALHRAGYDPVTLVWGHCTWFVLTTDTDEYTLHNYSNKEFHNWSTALGKARRIALDHARNQASKHNATGIAGVRIERRLDEVRLSGSGEDEVYKREHHNIVVSLIGTAVYLRKDAPRMLPATTPILSLRDGRIAPVVMRHTDATFE